jgi:hypothetical protein
MHILFCCCPVVFTRVCITITINRKLSTHPLKRQVRKEEMPTQECANGLSNDVSTEHFPIALIISKHLIVPSCFVMLRLDKLKACLESSHSSLFF